METFTDDAEKTSLKTFCLPSDAALHLVPNFDGTCTRLFVYWLHVLPATNQCTCHIYAYDTNAN